MTEASKTVMSISGADGGNLVEKQLLSCSRRQRVWVFVASPVASDLGQLGSGERPLPRSGRGGLFGASRSALRTRDDFGERKHFFRFFLRGMGVGTDADWNSGDDKGVSASGDGGADVGSRTGLRTGAGGGDAGCAAFDEAWAGMIRRAYVDAGNIGGGIGETLGSGTDHGAGVGGRDGEGEGCVGVILDALHIIESVYRFLKMRSCKARISSL